MEPTQIIHDIVQTTINSFNLTYCLIVNILTYCVIKLINDLGKHPLKTWVKRIVLLCCILSTGVVYWALGKDLELLVNSAILATVSWDMIFKPICNKLGIDYSKIDNTITK